MTVAAIILAAGASRRMGRSKPLLPWGEQTLLGWELDELMRSCVDDIVVVLGARAEAVRRELDRRRRAELRRSLENPHPESAELAEQGLEEWSRGLPEEDGEALVEASSGKAIRWVHGEGWVEDRD